MIKEIWASKAGRWTTIIILATTIMAFSSQWTAMGLPWFASIAAVEGNELARLYLQDVHLRAELAEVRHKRGQADSSGLIKDELTVLERIRKLHLRIDFLEKRLNVEQF